MTTTLRDADPAAELHPDPASPAAQALLHEILAAPREPVRRPRQRHRRGVVQVVAGLAAAAAVAAAGVGLLTGTEHRQAEIGPAGYRITTGPDGAVGVVIAWSKLRDPAALQADLDRVHAHVRVYVSHGAASGPAGWCAGPVHLFAGQLPESAVQYDNPGGRDGIVVHPGHFPSGVSMLLTVDEPAPGATGGSTLGPDRPRITGWSTVWATGAVPHCPLH